MNWKKCTVRLQELFFWIIRKYTIFYVTNLNASAVNWKSEPPKNSLFTRICDLEMTFWWYANCLATFFRHAYCNQIRCAIFQSFPLVFQVGILNLVSWSQKLAKTNYNILHGPGIYLLTCKLLKLSRHSYVTNCLVNWLFLRNCCPARPKATLYISEGRRKAFCVQLLPFDW